MKKILIVFLILPIFLCHGQKRGKFRKGAVIIEKTVSKNYTTPQSIYFVFKDDTHLVNFYKDLQHNLENVFDKSNIRLGFEYMLSSKNPLKNDLENVPKTTENYTDFQVIVAISLKFVKSVNSHNIYLRKQNYNINLELVDVKLNSSELKAVINVKTYNTIVTQNKKSAAKIYDILVSKQ